MCKLQETLYMHDKRERKRVAAMTIDDLIAEYRTMSTKENIIFSQRPGIAEKVNLQYKETVDCLEELKAYRENDGMSENVYRYGYKFGYNKAIDDFVELYKSKTTMENKLVYEIAEQLKGGKVE